MKKWHARAKDIAYSHMGSLLAALTYNSRAIAVLGYIAQLTPPPPAIFPQEQAVLHHIMHMPTNAFERSVFANLGQIGCKAYNGIHHFCQATLLRASHKTIIGWDAQWRNLREQAAELLPLRLVAEGALCSTWWDTLPFVHHLASAFYGTGSFAKSKATCDNMHTVYAQGNKRNIQALALKALCTQGDGYSFYFLFHRRCVPLGVSHLGVLSRRDVHAALECAKLVNHSTSIAWLKTVTNAWCTSHRMHETNKLNCIFGCRTSPDRLDHYITCNLLWSLLHEAFGGDFTPCLFARLNFSMPCERNLYILAAAFDIYHGLKIGLREVVDEANVSLRFATISHNAKLIARDHVRSLYGCLGSAPTSSLADVSA